MSDVRVVGVTRPLSDMDPEHFIVYMARVSNPKNQSNPQGAEQLLAYLVANRHWSPFEMVHLAMEIKTTRAIARQILRHRSFSFQEFSQRYAEATEFVPVEARRQDRQNRQHSIDDLPPETREWWALRSRELQRHSEEVYREALAKGIAKECARMVLPESTLSTMYMSGSIRSWIHYLQVRLDPTTQLEHRQVAQAVLSEFSLFFPTLARIIAI